MTTTELINELEKLKAAAGDWDVMDECGRLVIGVKLTPRGVELDM